MICQQKAPFDESLFVPSEKRQLLSRAPCPFFDVSISLSTFAFS